MWRLVTLAQPSIRTGLTRLVPLADAPATRVDSTSRRDDSREVAALVHEEAQLIVAQVGPLVLPELATQPKILGPAGRMTS